MYPDNVKYNRLFKLKYSWFYQAMKKAEQVGGNKVKGGLCLDTFNKEIKRVSGRASRIAHKFKD